MLGAALVLDQPRIVQREAAAQFMFQDRLQFLVVDGAVGVDGRLEFFWLDLDASARFEIDGAGGEVHGERDQAGDDVEQQANGIEGGDGRVDLAVDLAATCLLYTSDAADE